MKFVRRTFLAVLFSVAFAARASADHVGIDMSGTSPASVTTAVGSTTLTQTGMFSTCAVYAVLQGGTGGTLDVYIQTMFKQVNVAAGTWVDVAHFPQIAAGAAAAGYATTLTRWSSAAGAIIAGLNTASGTPLIAANTVVNGILGYQLRIVYKTGAGTSAGAAQTILVTCSSS